MGLSLHVRSARLGAVGIVVAAGLAAVVVPGSSATATGLSVPHGEAVCAAPAPGHASCFAMRLVGQGSAKRARVHGVRPRFTVGPAGGYTPATIAAAYGVNPAGATTQTVAIVDAFQDPNIRAELNTFNAANGLPNETSTSFAVVSQTGGTPTTVPLDTTGWSVEQALDVQAVRGLCHLCKILLVETNSNDNANLAVGENYAAAHALIVSNSFGGAESPSDQTGGYAAAFNHPGNAILVSTGDDGWYDFDYQNRTADRGVSSNVPASPASFNTVIAVAGTSLYLNADGTRASEDVWNGNGPSDNYGYALKTRLGASGGGCSTLYAAQLWQRQVSGYSSLGCGTARSTTDIAALADPSTGFDIYTSYKYASNAFVGWQTIGGTSLATPLVAALMGLAGGPHGVKYPALTLYGHYKSARATYDVTVGGNGACSTSTPQSCAGSYGQNPNTFYPGQLIDCAFGNTAFPSSGTPVVLANRYQCYANKGYDGVSGVGVPTGLSTFAALKPAASIANPGVVTHKVAKVFDGSHSTDPFPGGTIKTWSWKFGDGKTGTGAKPSHKYAAARKTYTVTLTVTDNYGAAASTVRKVTTR